MEAFEARLSAGMFGFIGFLIRPIMWPGEGTLEIEIKQRRSAIV